MTKTANTQTDPPEKTSPVKKKRPSVHVTLKKTISFRKRDKIPIQFNQAYTRKLLFLRPTIQRTQRRYYQASDIFKKLSKEPSRIIVKEKFSFLYPDGIGKKFSQQFGDPNQAQTIKETIVTYFNTFFFSNAADQAIDLTQLDGENIFTGKIDLLLNALKDALRRDRGDNSHLPNVTSDTQYSTPVSEDSWQSPYDQDLLDLVRWLFDNCSDDPPNVKEL